MEMIKNLQIDNYKSIKHLGLNCNRINVLIGEPNVGKSNILEALDLSYLSWMLGQNETNRIANKEQIDIKKYFRINKAADLFLYGDISKTISISHPGFSNGIELKFARPKNSSENIQEQKSFFEWRTGNGGFTRFDNDFITIEPIQYFGSPFDPYRYKNNVEFHDAGNYMNVLMPPFGNNLLEVIQHNSDFRKLIGELIEDFDLELNIDISDHKLFVQKKISTGVVYSMKYEALADTLRRIIFYVAAIRYNNGYILTLEEPDAHSFPKFVSFLGDEIIQDNKNQFFIATHSPYLLNNLIENTPSGDLGVFVCGFDKEKGTTVHKLSNEELSELLDYGVDIFFNINRYLDDRVEHSS
jgi:AAA15 family ATPase/GTPase